MMASPSIGPPPSPAYSTDDDHFSDAAEDMKEEEFEEAPSTPIRLTRPEINEENLATPKNVSPAAEKSESISGTKIDGLPKATIQLEKDIGQEGLSDAETETGSKETTLVVPSVITGPFEYGDKDDESVTPKAQGPERELLGSSSTITATIPGKFEKTMEEAEDPKSVSPQNIPTIPGGVQEEPLGDLEPSKPLEKKEQLQPNKLQFDYDEYEDGDKDDTKGDTPAEGEDGFGDDFGDDFDDFGEAVEGEDFDDFGEFGDDGGNGGFEATQEQDPILPAAPPPLLVPVIDFDSYGTTHDLLQAISPIVGKLFPPSSPEEDFSPKPLSRSMTSPPVPSSSQKMFLTERSESLWYQLVAPPPLQPPDWKRSRIRRLFLVSLGVPVDLDEILPASKQKKLVLPSTHSSRRNSTSSPSRTGRSKSRGRGPPGGESSSSRTPSSHPRRTDKNAPAPEFDAPGARILCSTSDVALSNFTAQELREHIDKLQGLTNVASEVLTYWLKKRDGAMGDKETFETVIESLVGYARKTRQSNR